MAPPHENSSLLQRRLPGVNLKGFDLRPTTRVPRDVIPPHRRFPNSLIWFDVRGDERFQVEPNSDPEFPISNRPAIWPKRFFAISLVARYNVGC